MPDETAFVTEIDVADLIQVLGLALVYAIVLSFTVAKCGRMLSDKTQYTVVFLALIPTMVLIISVVKSSLALSLGLVGALSVVRFRTPIKEPEELIYLFLAIATGLGLGAGQTLATSICFFVIVATLLTVNSVRTRSALRGVFMDIDAPGSVDCDVGTITSLLKRSSVGYELRRFVDSTDGISATFFIEAQSLDDVSLVIKDIKTEVLDASVTIIDTRRQLS